MTRKEPKNLAHSIFQRLLNLAKERGDDFNLMLQRYGMERFLRRLGASPHSGSFILKGASLFLVWEGRSYRVTKDADFLGFGQPSPEAMATVFKEICATPVEADGLRFSPDGISTEEIREGQGYGGVRVSIIGLLGNARINLQVDVGFGDAVIPAPEQVELPSLLDMPKAQLRAYTKYSVVAEKFDAMIRLGLANSRMKDFYDIWVMSKMFEFDGVTLLASLKGTFERRGTVIPECVPLALSKEFAEWKGKAELWNAFLKRVKASENPESLEAAIAVLSVFLLPPLDALRKGDAFELSWLKKGRWEAIR